MARELGITRASVRNRIKKMEISEADLEIVTENVRLAKQKQRGQDLNRISNKAFREHARIENAVEGYAESLVELLRKHGLPPAHLPPMPEAGPAVGILHLTDIHFNEVVRLAQNEYDFEIAGKRLRKLVHAAARDWRSCNIGNTLIAFTGDLLNSDRRLDELLANQDNRARATMGAVHILRQLIDEVVSMGFNVTVADVNGNEGRVPKDVGWVAKVASDNYDETICRMLEYLFEDHPRVQWVENEDATECVVEVAGQNVLLIHGHQLGKDMEASVGKLVSKYAKRGVMIRFTMSGHIHSGYLNENFARSPSPVGDNAYSDKALNLTGRAGGAYYTVEPDGSVHASLVDTQCVDGIDGYMPLKQYQASNPKSAIKAQGVGTVIHQVVI
jgi:predicted MPP superfamily phosphohydrolase